jgi:hypothetical protein
VIAKWEKLSGNVLEKIHIPADEFLASMKGNYKSCMSEGNASFFIEKSNAYDLDSFLFV